MYFFFRVYTASTGIPHGGAKVWQVTEYRRHT